MEHVLFKQDILYRFIWDKNCIALYGTGFALNKYYLDGTYILYHFTKEQKLYRFIWIRNYTGHLYCLYGTYIYYIVSYRVKVLLFYMAQNLQGIYILF